MTEYKLMPKQITKEMVDAFWKEYSKNISDDLLMRCYRAMYAVVPQPVQQREPVYLYRRLGLHDFVTCNHDRYAELSGKPHLFETKVLYTDT